MLLRSTHPFPADFPALGIYGVEPGEVFEVPYAEAEGLLAQGHEPADGPAEVQPPSDTPEGHEPAQSPEEA